MYNFDFNKMTISNDHAYRLNTFQAAAINQSKAGKRNKLWKLIEATEYDPARGLYIPLSNDVRLPNRIQFEFGNVPSAPVGGLQEPFPYRFFGNALLLPASAAADASPSSRLTNPGFIIVTHEFDPENVEHFDEIGNWFAGNRVSDTIFDQAHCTLKTCKDYRGYSVVYSGRRSYQIHFIFDTTALVNAPFNESAEQRLRGFEEKAALMVRTYEIVWEATKTALLKLSPPTAFDAHMDSPLQWRRSPFAIRQIESGKAIFGLQDGDFVPQLVVREDIASRAYPDASHPLIDPAISFSQPFARARNRRSNSPASTTALSNYDAVLEAIREACAREWTDYPRLERIGVHGGDYALYFSNHGEDRNPSTVVKGAYRGLRLEGRHEFGDKRFFLPDDFTANDIVAHWSRVFGSRAAEIPFDNVQPKQEIIQAARDGHRELIASHIHALFNDDAGENALLIDGSPGSGKSSCVLQVLKDRFDEDDSNPWEDSRLKVAIFCSVSLPQAELKREEFRQITGQDGVVWKGFWTVYGEICKARGVASIKSAMASNRPSDVWAEIEAEQPEIAQALIAHHAAMWSGIDKSQTVMVFTSVAALEKWPFGRVARAIWHPAFNGEMDAEELDALADSYTIQVCILDDYRADSLLYHFNEVEQSQIKRIKDVFPNWGRLTHRQKHEGFGNRPADLQVIGFERFNELAHVELGDLELVAANFTAIPFSSDTSEVSIYRKINDRVAAIGKKPWLGNLSCPKIFLTTESVVAAATRMVISVDRLIALELGPVAGIHPVCLPIVRDDRAAAQRAAQLADEILAANPDAVAICNGVSRDDGRVINFECVKGRNDLKDKDIYVIMTMLNPEEYFKLNTVGIFIGRQEIIQMHYRDLLTQATGRNTGYRDTGNGRKTVVIQGGKLERAGYFTHDALNTADPASARQFAMYSSSQKIWMPAAPAEVGQESDNAQFVIPQSEMLEHGYML